MRTFKTTNALMLAMFAGLMTVLSGCQRASSDQVVPNMDKARQIWAAMVQTGDDKTATSAKTDQPKRTGWGTLKGTILVEGTPPAPIPVTVTRDFDVCQPGGLPVVSHTISVGPSGGLANMALYALGLSGDNINPSEAPGKGEEVPYDQKSCVFLSHVKTMRAGQKLKILNSDSVSHNTLIHGKMNPEFNQTIPPGQFAVYDVRRPERAPIQVQCSIHPWMEAWLLPFENGYATVTNSDGSFEIPDLPAGVELKIQLWHEKLKDFKDVTVDGKQTSLARGVLPITLEPGKTRNVEIKIQASAFK